VDGYVLSSTVAGGVTTLQWVAQSTHTETNTLGQTLGRGNDAEANSITNQAFLGMTNDWSMHVGVYLGTNGFYWTVLGTNYWILFE
jgi:hypothetical protein